VRWARPTDSGASATSSQTTRSEPWCPACCSVPASPGCSQTTVAAVSRVGCRQAVESVLVCWQSAATPTVYHTHTHTHTPGAVQCTTAAGWAPSIKRTQGGKPFYAGGSWCAGTGAGACVCVCSPHAVLSCLHPGTPTGATPLDCRTGPATRPDAPNFNFNVSHEVWSSTQLNASGTPQQQQQPARATDPPTRLRRRCNTQGDFVVLACEGHCLCGVDVAAPQQLRVGTKPLLEVLELMRPQLTANEVSRPEGVVSLRASGPLCTPRPASGLRSRSAWLLSGTRLTFASVACCVLCVQTNASGCASSRTPAMRQRWRQRSRRCGAARRCVLAWLVVVWSLPQTGTQLAAAWRVTPRPPLCVCSLPPHLLGRRSSRRAVMALHLSSVRWRCSCRRARNR
jgi:hypothetical protein